MFLGNESKLGLSTAIADSSSATSAFIDIPLLKHGVSRFFSWNSEVDNNCLILYGDESDLSYWGNKINKNRPNLYSRIRIADLAGGLEDLGSYVSTSSYKGSYSSELTLEEAINELFSAYSGRLKKCRDAGILYPASRVSDIVILNLDDSILYDLVSDDELAGKFATLLEDGYRMMLPIFVFIKSYNPDLNDLLPYFNVSIWNKNYNKKQYLKIFNDRELEYVAASREIIGYCLNQKYPLTWCVSKNEVRLNRSEWYVKTIERNEIDRKVFNDFLEELE